MKLVVFAIFILIFFFGSASAQEADTSWLLLENDGDIYAVETVSGKSVNVTAALDEDATHPYWSHDGTMISFIIVSDAPTSRNETPYGVAAWTEFDGNFQINRVPRCEQSDILCTNASISGDLMVFTAVRQGTPVLYSFNISNQALDVLQSGGFEPENAANGWVGEVRYAVVGMFGSSQQSTRRFSVRTGQYETTSSNLLGLAYLGCNNETAVQIIRGAQPIVELSLGGRPGRDEFPGLVGKGDAWRRCDAPRTF